MFGFRTPVKEVKSSNEAPRTSISPTMQECAKQQNVRKSIGEWESGKTDPITPTTPKKSAPVETLKPKKALPQGSRVGVRAPIEAAGSPPAKPKYTSRLAEAKACLTKAKMSLGSSRNTKTEIKTEVLLAIERLYQLVKEAENEEKKQGKTETKKPEKERELGSEKVRELENEREKEERSIIAKMSEHAKLIEENSKRMEEIQARLEVQQERIEKQSYASVAAAHPVMKFPEQTALHSVVVTAKDDQETGDEVLKRIREAINAKEGGISVERVRKAKDRKVVVGCRTKEEREAIKERLKKAEDYLIVEEVKNKNPQVILKNVFKYNGDEDILDAIWKQNEKTLSDLDRTLEKMEIMYKKNNRNDQTQHVVMRVSPGVWQRLVHAGTVVIDLQRVRVADQSPLVQCSLCLGYGHGRRFCVETTVKCSHCGGPHMRTECADWLANAPPSCCNCTHAKVEKADHNAFSQECVIRRKWDALARATIAYSC